MSEGSGIMDIIRGFRKGTTDTRTNAVTTHREEAGRIIPPTPDTTIDFSTISPNKLRQPGENATELHPDDVLAIAEHKTSQQRQSDFAAKAITQSGTSAMNPVGEPQYSKTPSSEPVRTHPYDGDERFE